MAGGGVVTEKLEPISVSPILINGGKFLKWDDQDSSANINYIVKVDAKGQVLYWRPEDYSKDTDVLEVVQIRDVRHGPYAKPPKDAKLRELLRANCTNEEESTNVQERTISVCFGPSFVDVNFVNFVAPSIAEAREWGRSLFAITHNILEMNASPLKCLERFHTKICVQANQDGEVPAKTLVKHFSSNKEDKKRAYDALQSVSLAEGKKDVIKVSEFSFDVFLNFYNRLCTRQDLDNIFMELGTKNRPYLTTDMLVEFLNNSQRDPRLNEILYPYFTPQRAQIIINLYETNKDFAMKGYLSIEGLTKYLLSEDNLVISPERFLSIHQDMTAPLSHYFINSSHNTYLTGHQLTGKSSVEIYRQVLLAGCRCIELDCWDGRTEEQEPIITHGMTLVSDVPFKDVIEAIAESAFKTSDYPVILSFENHCSTKQQSKMANYCVNIFGNMLLNKALDDFPLEAGKSLPPPSLLKRKILIKNKKRAPKVLNTSVQESQPDEQTTQPPTQPEASNNTNEESKASDNLPKIGNSIDESEEGKQTTPREEKEIITTTIKETDEEETLEVETTDELSALVNYIQPVHFRGFEAAEKVKRYYEMSSFSESSATTHLKEKPIEFVNYNKRQLSRIYPKGSRVGSDNYMPQVYWNAGCQLVALNFQTLELPMMLNLGKFEVNGRCGYLLKPDFMCRCDRTFDPFAESTVDGIIAGTVHVKVISGQCLAERKTGTYVEVDMYGLPADTVRRKFKTKVVPNNGINPVYDEEAFTFKKVILPSLAVLRIAAYEENGKLIGHRVLPVNALSPGYRHINLRNESYMPCSLPSLFVHIITKDYVPSGFADFAEALANPIQFLSEEEKRGQQLEALMMDEEAAPQESTPSQTEELKVPEKSYMQRKRGSIGILTLGAFGGGGSSGSKGGGGISNGGKGVEGQNSKDSVPTPKPLGPRNSFSGATRTKSLQPVRPTSVSVGKFPRSKSTIPSQLDGIKDELMEIKAPTLQDLRRHKMFTKLRKRLDNETSMLIQRHRKEKLKLSRDFENQLQKIRSQCDKTKTNVQRRHSKDLKRAEKVGSDFRLQVYVAEMIKTLQSLCEKSRNYEESYRRCLEEIGEMNERQENEVEALVMQHKEQLKVLFRTQYMEQLNFAKDQIEPEFIELGKAIESSQDTEKKKLSDRHNKEMQSLKKEQDRFNRGELERLAREFKDKGELQRMKREQNKKHIEQAVKERQKLKEVQEKEINDLTKQYEELVSKVAEANSGAASQLDELHQQRLLELDNVDLLDFSPVLIKKQGGSCGVP